MGQSAAASDAVSVAVVAAAARVAGVLGAGYSPVVYRNALAQELRRRGKESRLGAAVPVEFDGVRVGLLQTDLLVQRDLAVSVICAPHLSQSHAEVCLRFLAVTGIKCGLLLNFGSIPPQHRRVLSDSKKLRSDT